MFLENKTADFEIDSERLWLMPPFSHTQLFRHHCDTVGNHGNGDGWKGV